MAEDPSKPSSDYAAMKDLWKVVQDILDGAPALRAVFYTGGSVYGPALPVSNLDQLQRTTVIGAQSPYLPKFVAETDVDYDRRRRDAPLTNIYADCADDLASKPFSRECTLPGDTDQRYLDLEDDIDGQGRSLHVFAQEQFRRAINKGVDYIFVDFTKSNGARTQAEERAQGSRPYWIAIPAERMLAIYSEFLNGQEVITHCRIYEPKMVRIGFDEVLVERVRVLDRTPIYSADGNQLLDLAPATWQLWELIKGKDDKGNNVQEWRVVDAGGITIGLIPVVPVLTAGRCGSGWRVEMPLKDLALMQIEEFQQESNLKATKEQAAFPMLVGEGVTLKDESGAKVSITVGPKQVLTAPPTDNGNGTWKYIEPAATSLTFLAEDLEKLRKNMRELGKQPITEAQLTVVTTANVSMRATSAVQAWAILYKDALEIAMFYTALWFNDPNADVEVDLFTDFAAISGSEQDIPNLLKAESQSIFSKQTVREEFKRRGKMSQDYDPTKEEELIAEEQQGLGNETVIGPDGQPMILDPRTGQMIKPTPPPGGTGGDGTDNPTIN